MRDRVNGIDMPGTHRCRVAGNSEAIQEEGRSPKRISVDASPSVEELDTGSSDLVRDLLAVSQLVVKTRSHVAREAGVTAFQYGAVLAISELRSVPVGALAASLAVSSQFISSEIAKLEMAGIVKRRPKEHDMRGSMIELTRRGRELVRKNRPMREAVDGAIFRGATQEETACFRKVMSIVRNNCQRALNG